MPEFSLTPEDVGERLDRYVTRQLPMHSRAYVQQLIDAQQIVIDGRATKAGYRLRAGDRISVSLPPPKPSGIRPRADSARYPL